MATTAKQLEPTDRHLTPVSDAALPPALVDRLRRRVTTVGEREPLDVVSPLTGEKIGDVPSGTGEDIEAAVRTAREAQRRWSEWSFKDRARVMMRFHDLVFERQGEVLDLIQVESGKARGHAFEEVADVAIVAAYYARTAAKHLAPRRREGALPLLTKTLEVHHPVGVVGFIAPWNYPLSMAITDAIPALMAGNGAVLKPAQQTPLTALWAVDLMYEAGLPEGLLGVVTGRGSQVGTPLIDNVDFVTFTGSTETGRHVAAQAAERLIGCSLELGGKNAMLVLDDADLGKAVSGAVNGCFASAGQLCISIERIFVHTSLIDDFTARFVQRVEALKLSSERDWHADMGSLVSQDQMDTVRAHIDDAVAKGATVLAGGNPRPDLGPLMHEPTVLADVTPDMEVYGEETFGPVVAIYPYTDLDDAIARANDTRYGLNASVWTRNARRGQQVARRLESGTVNINEAYAAAWASVDAPMGGFKDSGLSRRHGAVGITKYTETQNVAAQRLMPVAQVPGLDADDIARMLSKLLPLMHKLPGLRRP